MTRELDRRAIAYAMKQCGLYGDEKEIFHYEYNQYIEIAAEQHKIDVDKASEWCCDNCEIKDVCFESNKINCPTIKSITKAMEQ